MLTTYTWELRRVCEIVDSLDENVKSASIEYNGHVYAVRWNEDDGHVITWKEPRK
jgi:hypothetical protein